MLKNQQQSPLKGYHASMLVEQEIQGKQGPAYQNIAF